MFDQFGKAYLNPCTIAITSEKNLSDVTLNAQYFTDSAGKAVVSIRSEKTGFITIKALNIVNGNTITLISSDTIIYSSGKANINYCTIMSSAGVLESNGIDSAAIVIKLADGFDNAISGGQVVLTSSRGMQIDNLSDTLLYTLENGYCTSYIRSSIAGASRISIASPINLNKEVIINFAATFVCDTNTEITLDKPAGVIADLKDSQYVTLTLKDAAGNRIINTEVSMMTNRGDTDRIYTDTIYTNSAGQFFARITSDKAGTAAIYITKPAGISKTASFRFNPGVFTGFNVGLYSRLNSDFEYGQSDVKKVFAVGTDSAIIRLAAIDRYSNVIDTYSGSINVLATNGALASIDTFGFINGVCTGILRVTTSESIPNFSVILNNLDSGMATGLSAVDNIKPVIKNIRLASEYGVNGIISQDDVRAELTAVITDNSNTLTKERIKANISALTGIASDTEVAAKSFDNDSKLASWTITLKSLTDGENISYSIKALDADKNETVYSSNIRIDASLNGYYKYLPDSTVITAINGDTSAAAYDAIDSIYISITLTNRVGNPVIGETISIYTGVFSDTIIYVNSLSDSYGKIYAYIRGCAIGGRLIGINNDIQPLLKAEFTNYPQILTTARISKGGISNDSGYLTAGDTGYFTTQLLDQHGEAFLQSCTFTISFDSGLNDVIKRGNYTTDATGKSTIYVYSEKTGNIRISSIQDSAGTTTAISMNDTITYISGIADSIQSSITTSDSDLILSADNIDSALIVIHLADKFGNIISGLQTIIKSSRGIYVDSLIPTVLMTDQNGNCSSYISSMVSGTSRISIWRPLNIEKEIVINFVATSVCDTNTEITLDKPAGVIADLKDSQYVTVILKDAGGNRIINTEVSMTTNRGASDRIYSDTIYTDSAGQFFARITSDKAGTAAIYITKPAGISKTASFRFVPGVFSGFNVGLYSQLNSDFEYGQSDVKKVFAVGNDSAILRLAAVDSFGNVIDTYTGIINVITPNGAVIAIDTFGFINGVCTGLFRITTGESIPNFSLIFYNGIDSGVITDLRVEDKIKPLIKNVRLASGYGINGVLSQDDISAELTAVITDNSNSLTKERITANISAVTGIALDTSVSAISYDSVSGIARWTITLKRLTNGENISYSIQAFDADKNETVYLSSLRIDASLNGYYRYLSDSTIITAINGDTSVAAYDAIDSIYISVTLKNRIGNPVIGETVSIRTGVFSDTIIYVNSLSDSFGKIYAYIRGSVIGGRFIGINNDIPLLKAEFTSYPQILTAARIIKSGLSNDSGYFTAGDTGYFTAQLLDQHGEAFSKSCTFTISFDSSLQDVIKRNNYTTDSTGKTTIELYSEKTGNISVSGIQDSTGITLAIILNDTMTYISGIADSIQSSITVSDTTLDANNVDNSSIVIRLADKFGNVITGCQTIIKSSRGIYIDSLVPTVLITDQNGYCTSYIRSAVSGTSRISIERPFNINKEAIVNFTATFACDTNTEIVLEKPAEVTADLSDSQYVMITLKDINGNRVLNTEVSIMTNRGNIDRIYSNNSFTNDSGQYFARIISDKAGTATIYITKPAGLLKTKSFEFKPGRFNGFDIGLYSQLSEDFEYGQNIVKKVFLVGNDSAIIRIAASDRFSNVIDTFTGSIRVLTTNNAQVLIDTFGFINGICTGVLRVTCGEFIPDFSVILYNGQGSGMITGLSAEDNIKPVITNVRLTGQSGLTDVLSQDDTTAKLIAIVTDNCNSLTKELIKANISNLTGSATDTAIAAESYDSATGIASWTISLKRLADGESIAFSIQAFDIAKNDTSYFSSVSVYTSLKGYSADYLNSNTVIISSADGTFKVKIPAGSEDAGIITGSIIFSVEYISDTSSSVYKKMVDLANDKYAQNTVSSVEFDKVKKCHYRVKAYHYTGTRYLTDISGSFLKAGKPAALSIKYPSDISGATAQNLVVTLLNELTSEWINQASSIDYNERAVTCEINHFSVYNLGFVNYNDMNSIVVYPNPWTSYTATAGLSSADKTFGIKFNGLPKNTIILIYNVAGELVKRIDSGSNNLVNWDLQNNSGTPAASGVYLYIIESSGQKKTGKIAIVK